MAFLVIMLATVLIVVLDSLSSVTLLILVIICAVVALVQAIIQLVTAYMPPVTLEHNDARKDELVSVHVASYNEPYELLNNTIRSFTQLSPGSRAEVLVIDNNTKDQDVWRPVEAFVKTLGEGFRFFHVEKMTGYKAGALNYVNQFTHPEAKYISTVDADYAVEPLFILDGLSYFTDEKIGFVQFPQAYKNVDGTNIGIFLEYEHYFANYMNTANRTKSVTATGTLTIFRRSALEKLNGYNTKTITEDADIGLRLSLAGYYGVYVDKVVGTGLMPYDLESYKKQKSRWARGNADVIKNYWFNIISSGSMTVGQKFGLFTQLVAWLSPTLPLIMTILVGGLISVLGMQSSHTMAAFYVAGTALTSYFVLKFFSFFYTFTYKYHYTKIIKAYLVHVGMHWVYAVSFWETLLESRLHFERTNKFILPKMPSIIKNTQVEILIGSVALLVGIVFTHNHMFIEAFFAGIVAASSFLIFYVWLQLQYTKPLSARIMKEIADSFN